MRRAVGPVRSAGLAAALAVTALLPAGCGGPEDGGAADTIEPEVFVDAYVDLRRATLSVGEGASLDDEERRRILDEHGVTEEQLLRFAEVHGDDPAFMAEVWDSVTSRITPAADTVPGGG